MARIRTIKPEFFTSEDIVSLTPLARLFYVSLWCEADREGRLEWKPRTLKMRYLPGDDCDVVSLGKELIDLGLVVLYEVDGKQYAEIPTFKKHQVINNRESASALPTRASRVDDASNGIRPKPKIDASLTRASRVKAEGREGREGDSVEPQSASPPPPDPPADPPAEPVVRLPLVDGTEHGVTAAEVDEWSRTYPAVSVLQQLREMRAWCLANPANRKTPRGINAFIVKWLSKEQDRAPRVAGGANGAVVAHPSAATPDEAVMRRISERNGGLSVQRLPDGRLKCGVHYYRPNGQQEVAI